MPQNKTDHLLPAQALALTQLADELSELADWPCVEVDAVLLLYDVLSALHAQLTDVKMILGEDVYQYVMHQLNDRRV
jgi:hypothetical protein